MRNIHYLFYITSKIYYPPGGAVELCHRAVSRTAGTCPHALPLSHSGAGSPF